MTRVLAFVLSATLPFCAHAQQGNEATDPTMIRPAETSDLSEFLWTNRPVIVFADTPADPRYGEQLALLQRDMDMLIERDVVVLTDTDPAAGSPLRKKLRPRGFQMVLVGKDGSVKLRKPFPYSVRELTRTIDKMPTRQQEIRERRAAG
ncbi:MAG: DUF4174 domain-containing protein [Rhodobacteraceae bacterium]|nr:DUF4174 domain-containing protein [Paracoccaceae bacterium]